MARYVMANRRAGKFMEAQKSASREALDAGFNELFAASVDVVNDLDPPDTLARRVVVFDADPEEIAAKAPTLSSDVMVEPEILHFPVGSRGAKKAKAGAKRANKARGRPNRRRSAEPLTRSVAVNPAALGGLVVPGILDAGPSAAAAFTIVVTGSGAPLHGAEVLLFLRGPVPVRDPLRSLTNASGVASFNIPSGFQAFAAVASPAGGHWSTVLRNPAPGASITCPAIAAAVGSIDWWHRQFGVTTLDPTLGRGIKVGVLDTGVGPHGCLAHVVRAGAFINGGHDPAGAADVDSHGSHVCGLIGARPTGAADRAGMAPGADMFAARVFPGPHQGASQADIANALDHLSRTLHADLINMSLGASQPSQIERDAIQDAVERGTLCVCAAGNESGAVNWPAAFPEVIAVSALGLQNTSPAGSVSSLNVPTDPAKHGAAGVFLASFSCFGPEIDTIAPGSATISTVPERFGLTRPFAVMDGTSMASPLACGALAALLGRSTTYAGLSGTSRTEEARRILRDHCVGVGLAANFQGRGILRVF